MVGVAIRAFSTVIAVVIAVTVASVFGDTAAGKVWAAALIAAVIGAIEWFQIWAPKHSAVVRRLLDPRFVHVGVWLQRVTTTTRDGVRRALVDEPNWFAIYWIDCDQGTYGISGFAYDIKGKEVARWRSKGSPEFTSDGQSMTYRFEGEIIGAEQTL